MDLLLQENIILKAANKSNFELSYIYAVGKIITLFQRPTALSLDLNQNFKMSCSLKRFSVGMCIGKNLLIQNVSQHKGDDALYCNTIML